MTIAYVFTSINHSLTHFFFVDTISIGRSLVGLFLNPRDSTLLYTVLIFMLFNSEVKQKTKNYTIL